MTKKTKHVPTKALDQHIAILGKTGSGKTYAAKGIVEDLLDESRQVCVLDPTGAWWGLRLSADGTGAGYDVVLLGGPHADVPLAPKSGEAVARLITEQGARAVIDTSGFTVGEYTRWFIDFAGTLYTTIRKPLHLVIDEAHYFMPQGKSPDVDAGRMLHAGNRLMSGGRSKGLRGLLITQRPAKLHKDSLTCADTLVAMRVIAPQDRQAIKEWIDGAGDTAAGHRVLSSLAGLARGEGWVWWPEGSHLERVKFGAIKTYDSSATPEHGASSGPSVAPIDLEAVRAAMAEATREAEANDPKKLRARIADLERQLAGAVDEAAEDKLADLGVKFDEALEDRDRAQEALGELRGSIQNAIQELQSMLSSHPNPTREPRTPIRPPPPRTEPSPRRAMAESKLTPRQQRFLDAAAALQKLGTDVTRVAVCGWVGVHPRGGSVGEELNALARSGLIRLDRGNITVTADGLAAAAPMSVKKAIDNAISGLSPRRARIFEIIYEAWPNAIERDSIAARLGIHPRGGSFGEDLGALVGRGLVERDRGLFRVRDFVRER